MNVLVSPFNNPFVNLALEDYFLRSDLTSPLVFFYVNRPSVILGRFQNPWIECNLPYLSEENIWIVRRQSGGGCVYHDHGNLNYSFLYPDGKLNRRKGVEIIKEAFAKADIDLTISERHDLWLQGKKISGSAFKQTKDSCFHHGTFLVSSDLKILENCLKQTTSTIDSKSIPSVRSKVTRIQDHYPHFNIEDVIELISHHLNCKSETLDPSLLSHPEVLASFQRFISWEWLWGETPYFKLEDGMQVHKGMVKGESEFRFERESMRKVLSEHLLDQLFPCFEQQNKEINLIF